MSMNIRFKNFVLAILTCTCLISTVACAGSKAILTTNTAQPSITTIPPTKHPELSQDQLLTLNSLEKVDDYPLYVMRYYAEYEIHQSFSMDLPYQESMQRDSGRTQYTVNNWGCSLFAALGDPEQPLFGRNFDWRYSPALLLYTYPKVGNASVSVVDIEYLVADDASHIMELPFEKRLPLLAAPEWPFDGMNTCGLAIGMAAVPYREGERVESQKPNIGSLEIIREILDHACTIDEAIELMNAYKIRWDGGPALHYLIADGSGEAVLIEFLEGEIQIMTNQKPWHQATNFLLSEISSATNGICYRYDAISGYLIDKAGSLTSNQAMALLSKVSQDSTQWSIVYNLMSGEIQVSIGKRFEHPYTFQLTMKK